MVEIIAGKYGPKLLESGAKIRLSSEEEARLVRRRVAKYVKDSDVVESQNTYVSKSGETVTYGDEYVFKSEDEIRIMKKAELAAYASEIGFDDFNQNSTKEEMVDSIMNFIEENSEDIEEVIGNGV